VGKVGAVDSGQAFVRCYRRVGDDGEDLLVRQARGEAEDRRALAGDGLVGG
jgi:hypothetical protein